MDSPAENGHALLYEQVQKLHAVLSEPIQIQPPNNFPTLSISPAAIVKVVRQRLLDQDITIRDIRLNGSAASHCLCEERENLPQIHFNDVDLIFGVSVERDHEFHVIKEEVLTSLLTFFPEDVSTERISCHLLDETYVKKKCLVSGNGNRWSLISLGDGMNKSIELKFVSVMKRQFEFTVDSFQIILDSYFNFDKCCDVAISQSFFPSVQAVSMYRDFFEAMDHLNNRLIGTEAPEQIRGGGLLKYCSLLVNGFRPADREMMEKLEPYMCSRFFIDFPSAEAQYHILDKYVFARFLQVGQFPKSVEFLDTLFRVVSCRARCLMETERHKTISVILQFRGWILSQHLLPPPIPFLPPVHGHPTSPFALSIPMHFSFEPSRMSPPPFHPKQWLAGPTQVR